MSGVGACQAQSVWNLRRFQLGTSCDGEMGRRELVYGSKPFRATRFSRLSGAKRAGTGIKRAISGRNSEVAVFLSSGGWVDFMSDWYWGWSIYVMCVCLYCWLGVCLGELFFFAFCALGARVGVRFLIVSCLGCGMMCGGSGFSRLVGACG